MRGSKEGNTRSRDKSVQHCKLYRRVFGIVMRVDKSLSYEKSAKVVPQEEQWLCLFVVIPLYSYCIEKLIRFVDKSPLIVPIHSRRVVFVEEDSSIGGGFWQVISNPQPALLGPRLSPCIPSMFLCLLASRIQTMDCDYAALLH